MKKYSDKVFFHYAQFIFAGTHRKRMKMSSWCMYNRLWIKNFKISRAMLYKTRLAEVAEGQTQQT